MRAVFSTSALRATGLAAVLACSLNLSAQEYRFQYLGAEQGLSNLAVKNLYQDRQGFLWVSTEDGVFRYDGQRFQAFDVEEGLPASSGVSFAELADGSLLVGGDIGLYRMTGSRFAKLTLPGSNSVSWVGGIKSDTRGRTYVATGAGLVVLAGVGGSKELSIRALTSPPGVSSAATRGLALDGDAVWYGCGDQLCRLNGEEVRVYGASAGLPAAHWLAIGRAANGEFWVRGRGVGAAALAPGAATFHLRETPLPASGISGITGVDFDGFLLFPSADGLVIRRHDDWWKVGAAAGLRGVAYVAMQDREGSIWIGLAGRGLVRWSGYRSWESYGSSSGLGSDLVYQILPQKDGTVWAGTESGLLRGTRKDDRYVWQRQASVGSVPVHSVLAGPDGMLWLGTEVGGVARLNPATGAVQWIGHREGLDAGSPFTLAFDRDHHVWAATENGLFIAALPFHRFELVKDLPRKRFWALAVAPNGGVWAGGEAGLFHLASGGWERLTPLQGLSHDEVLALGAARNGEVWIGYRFGGEIDKVVAADGKLEVLHIAHQRPGGTHLVYFLGFDAKDRLWVGTEHGVDILSGGQWSHMDSNDGLAWDDCDLNGFAAEPDGSVWIGTSGGLAHFIPLPHPPPAYPFSVVFTRLTLGKSDRVAADRPSVDYASNRLIAQYSDLNFTHGNALFFRYRLSPLFTEWRTTDRRELEFPSLPPDSYRLDVEVRDPWGNWSTEAAAFQFDVRGPWFRSWWFLTLCAAAAIALFALFIRIRIMVHWKREVELVGLVEQRTADLKKANEELVRLSATDGLTGVANRRAFDQTLAREWSRFQRTAEPLSMLLLDVDHFKILNDTEGHQHGDHCLAQLAAELRRAARREIDLVARYGGEEFAIVLPATGADAAMQLAERIRQSVAGLWLSNSASPVAPFLTVSIGAGTAHPGMHGGKEEFLASIDRALYSAKHAGRNRVAFFDKTECEPAKAERAETLPTV